MTGWLPASITFTFTFTFTLSGSVFMRAFFSLLGLIVVLAIVGVLIKTQMRSPAASTRPAAAASPDMPVVPVVTPANAKQVQDKIKADIERSLQQAPRDVPE